MQPLYNIPVISQNLRREETIVQAVDALKHLSEVSNDIFKRINRRIETNLAHLETITKRIETAQSKVVKLHGAKKATRVFSSSKYPAINIHRHYGSIFDKEHKISMSHSKYKYKDIQVKEEPLEALQFYHVKVENVHNHDGNNGLGDIPIDINTMNDLLLYNTGKNPYINYVISDPLQASSRLNQEETSNYSGIGAPPHSLLERATVTKSKTDSYLYSPDLGNVPVIDVPLDLPDLPGIADDLRYTDQTGPGIAPSVTTTPLVPDLPPIADIFINDVAPDLPVVPEVTPVTIPDLQEIPTEVKELEVEKSENIVEVQVASPQLNITSELPIVTDAHASLMEAIRKAGGSTSSKVKAPEPKKPPSGDLMADLHAKLSLRRKGISGLKNQEQNASSGNLDSNSTLQRISAMIPPPPMKVEQSDSTNTEDEDWDD